MAALEPIPRHMSLVPWQLPLTPSKLAALAFIQRISEEIAAGLGLPLEAVPEDWRRDVSTPMSRLVEADRKDWKAWSRATSRRMFLAP